MEANGTLINIIWLVLALAVVAVGSVEGNRRCTTALSELLDW